MLASVSHPQARTEVESLGQRVSAAFAAYQRDRDGVLAELAALETELSAPAADVTARLPPLEPGPEEVRHHTSLCELSTREGQAQPHIRRPFVSFAPVMICQLMSERGS